MSKLYDTYTPDDEKIRISRVEIFDEVEEWNLIQVWIQSPKPETLSPKP